MYQFSSVQSLSHAWLFATPWTAACQASVSITNSWSLLKPMSTESVMPSHHLILCRPLLLPPLTFPSIRVFSNESVLRIKWPRYWSFSFSISPSNEYSGLISFRMDWLDLLALQGTLKSLVQHHSSKVSILPHSAFFIVQILHPYMTTGKTMALNRWTFINKVRSLFFNMLSRLVIAFLPRSQLLLISWLQSPSSVILESKKTKSLTVSIVFPSICQKWWDWMPWSSFWMLSFKPAFSLPSFTFIKKKKIQIWPLGRLPEGGNGNWPQYSCLGNPMDRRAWWATVHAVEKRRTQLSDGARMNAGYMCLFQLWCFLGIFPVVELLDDMVVLEKVMTTYSSTLAWKIPWMEEPGRLQSMVSLRVGHDWATSL